MQKGCEICFKPQTGFSAMGVWNKLSQKLIIWYFLLCPAQLVLAVHGQRQARSVIITLLWGVAKFVSPRSYLVRWILVSGKVAEGVVVIRVVIAHKMKHQLWCLLLF